MGFGSRRVILNRFNRRKPKNKENRFKLSFFHKFHVEFLMLFVIIYVRSLKIHGIVININIMHGNVNS